MEQRLIAIGIGNYWGLNMKAKRTRIFCFVFLMGVVLMASCSKERESGMKEGDEIRFSIVSSELETRTVYGERSSTKQPILWQSGDVIHIIAYNPNNYSGDHQYAQYRVTTGGVKRSAIEPVSDPLTWKSTQTKVVAYYLPGAVSYIDPDHGEKGFLFSRFFFTQEGTVDAWPKDYDQHTSPVQNMSFAPLFVSPTDLTSGEVELYFQPLFTAFEITLENTFSYARYVYGVRIWNNDGNPIAGDYVVNDLTQPLSGALNNFMGNYPLKYYAGIDYSGDTGGPYADQYLARVNGTDEDTANHTPGTFTFTIFCPPLDYTDMSIQVCGGDGYSSATPRWFNTQYYLTKNHQYIQFARQKKHAVEIELPDHYNYPPQ